MELRDRIIEESSKLFHQYGIRAITMDDIAKHLGISKRTVYENFKDKDELLGYCFDYFHKINKERYHTYIQESSNTIEAFFKLLDSVSQFMKTINPLYFIDFQKYHHKVWRENHERHEQEKYCNMTTLLSKGIEEGLIRNDINTEIVTRILFEQMHLLGNDEVFPPDRFPKLEVFENIMVNFVRGISTTKGSEIIEELHQKYKQTR